MKSKLWKFIIALVLPAVMLALPFGFSNQRVDAFELKSDDSFILSDTRTVTLDEMIFEIAQNDGVSEDLIRAQLGFTTSSQLLTSRNETYRVREYTMLVKNGYYKPKLVFYYSAPSSSSWEIKKMIRISMNRVYQSTSKQFQGEVYINIESPSIVYTEVNGDFYDNGTTTTSLGGAVGISLGPFTIGFSASSTTSSNHYAGYYKRGRIDVTVVPQPR